MIITTNDKSVESSGLGQTAAFGIKNSAAAFQLLSSGLYTNKIRAVLREIGCNGVDAHALNGNKDKPIEVKLPNRLDSQFHIRDFGPGLSHDQIMKLYSTYFDSTKQASDDYIGGFGVGSKSPFAYTDAFTVISRHKGMERVYAAFVNDEGMPTIAQMGEEVQTSENDGLTVGFPVKPEDFQAFESEAKEVYSAFKVPPTILGLAMDLKRFASKPVVDGVSVIVSTSNNHWEHRNELNLNMGGVRYPLTAFSEKLRNANENLSPEAAWLYAQGVEIDVPIGSVSVAASREALQYDKKTMAAIPGIIHEAAQRCLVQLQDTLNAIDKSKSPVERAQELREALSNMGNLAWKRVGEKVMKNLFPDPADRMACQMALTGKYTVETENFPALHLWYMQGSLHERIHEHGVKGFSIDDYEGRKKIVTSLRRNWNLAMSADQGRALIFAETTHSLCPAKDGGPLVKMDFDGIELELSNVLPVFESDRAITIEALLENHQAQPTTDYHSRPNKKFIVCPVAQFDKDKKPVALTAAQLQEFETQKAAFYKQYSIKPETLKPLSTVTAPVKVKAAPAVWTIPLDVRQVVSLKRTLRGIPSSEVGQAHHHASRAAMAYVVYDRKSSQDNMHRFHSSDLMQQSNKYAEYLQYSTQLKKYNIPTDVQLVDKKDLPAFKTMYPHAMPFSQYLENLRKDPSFQHEMDQWANNRPKLVHMDHYAELWVALAKKIPDLSPASLLAQLVQQWTQHSTLGGQYGEDSRKRQFYNLISGKQFPENTLINTSADVAQLNDVYPYIRYFDYNTPDSIKKEYITSINDTWGWGPVRATNTSVPGLAPAPTPTPTPYPAGPMP